MKAFLQGLGKAAGAWAPTFIVVLIVSVVCSMVSFVAAVPKVGQICSSVVYSTTSHSEAYGVYEFFEGRMVCGYHLEGNNNVKKNRNASRQPLRYESHAPEENGPQGPVRRHGKDAG